MSKYQTVFIGIEYTITATTWSDTVVSEKDKSRIKWSIVIDGRESSLPESGISVKYTFKKEHQGKKIIFKAHSIPMEDCVPFLAYVSRSNVAPVWVDHNTNEIIDKIYYGGKINLELRFQKNHITLCIYFTSRLEDKEGNVKKEISSKVNWVMVKNSKATITFDINKDWRDLGPKETLFDLYLSVNIDNISLIDNKYIHFDDSGFTKQRLLIEDFFVDKEGFVINPRVERLNLPNFGRKERPNLFNRNNPVKAIVLHRTDGHNGLSAYSTAISTGENGNQGGHFTIEGKEGKKKENLSGIDGAIYQFANLKKAVNHTGNIRKRPAPGTPKPWDSSSKTVTKNELNKKYPERFPYNGDSIGIEVVGKCVDKTADGWEAEWEPLTQEQITNTAWLTNGLLKHFSLNTVDDLYVHEQISSKTWDEGGVVLKAIKKHLR